jgi:(p)ppGpp synthase/HD superfamily hydrolase
MDRPLDRAIAYATLAHKGQKRKYTGAPYIGHPIEVMGIVKTVPHTTEMLMAAVLHDTVEDTEATLDDIEVQFGKVVKSLVSDLTDISDPEDGNRAFRKAKDREHSINASAQAQTIKYADLISNSESIMKHDPGFAKVYMQEKKLLLDGMTKGNATLRNHAMKIVDQYHADNKE